METTGENAAENAAETGELSALEARLRQARDRAAAMTARIPERIGPYRIHEALGEGGMGYVYRASHETLARDVALKLIRAEHRFAGGARERFLREARVASRLEHPNLCRVYEFGEHEGLPWFAMQLVDGATLAEAIEEARRAGKASLAEANQVIELFLVILEALHTAHESGLVHRDIKPSNIVLREDGSPVVLDFGVARDNSSFDNTLTASGQMIGTPLYLPREQVDQSGRRDDRRWDVYSCAITLYECLTLQRPFDGDSPAEIFDSILAARPTKIRRHNPAVSRDLELVVETAMDPDVERRYEDCARFAADLRRALHGEAIQARAPGPVLRTRRWVRANPVAASVLAMMGVATIATGTQWLRAETNLERVHLLAAQVQLDELREDPALTLPARPEMSARLQSFLENRAEPLLARIPRFVRVRDQLRARALPYDDASRARDPHPRAVLRRTLLAEVAQLEGDRKRARELRDTIWVQYADKEIATRRARLAKLEADPADTRSHYFAVLEDKFLHDGLDRLIADLGDFKSSELRHLRAQLDWSRRVTDETMTKPSSAWKACAERVRANPAYAGLALEPQLGLLPLGADPVSGLEEFAFLRSGSAPARDADGRLRYEDGSAIVLVLVPGGSAQMGSRGDESGARTPDGDECPAHEVKLGAFFVGKHEVTQAQWKALANGERPSRFLAGKEYLNGKIRITPRHPVERVSHSSCVRILALHDLTLPTEAQWEYACRAGTRTSWWPGDNRSDLAGCDNVGDLTAGEINKNWSFEAFRDGYLWHAPVGSFRPNPFGLHDLHGNVREWCLDRFQTYDRVRPRPEDGLRTIGAVPSDTHILRGGAFDYRARACRSARRDNWGASRVSANLGLRVARRLERR